VGDALNQIDDVHGVGAVGVGVAVAAHLVLVNQPLKGATIAQLVVPGHCGDARQRQRFVDDDAIAGPFHFGDAKVHRLRRLNPLQIGARPLLVIEVQLGELPAKRHPAKFLVFVGAVVLYT
jgi:hypothetical protein